MNGKTRPSRATVHNHLYFPPVAFLSFCLAALTTLCSMPVIAQTYTPPRTTYYLHGRIYTNDPQHPWASAMAVREGKIVCIGGIEQIMLECGGGSENAETIQLGNKFVMPGFNDAHVHSGNPAADLLAVRP